MRFMIIRKADADTEAGVMPSAELLNTMSAYNERLVEAGVMLAGEGLQPSSKGARVVIGAEEPTVTDGPFAEAEELVAGFTMIQVDSLAEAIEWGQAVAKRRRSRRARNPPGVRSRRLRRRIQARHARGRRTHARANQEHQLRRISDGNDTALDDDCRA